MEHSAKDFYFYNGRNCQALVVSQSCRRIFVYIFFKFKNICLSLSDEGNEVKSLHIETISVIFKNLSSIYQMVSKKFSFKSSKFCKECMAH